MRRADIGGPFEFSVALVAGRVFALEVRGHMTHADVGEVRAALDRALGTSDGFSLLIDSRELTGFDLDARAVATRWSRSLVAARGAFYAVVAGSELLAAESPAAAFAPPSRARVFGSRDGALRFLAERDSQASGTFPAVGQALPVRADIRRSG